MGRICFHRISLGCPKTKNWGSPEDAPIPDHSSPRHGPVVPVLCHRPSPSCHHTESKWASSCIPIWPSSLHRTKRGVAVTTTAKKNNRKAHVHVKSRNNKFSVRMRDQVAAEQREKAHSVNNDANVRSLGHLQTRKKMKPNHSCP